MHAYTVGVVFTNSYHNAGQVYHYKFDRYLSQGQLAVVYARDEYKVVKVVSCSEGFTDKATKWIVDTFSTERYTFRELAEAKEKEIRAKLKARASKISDIAYYETLAKTDDVMAKLLQELKEVGNY